MTERRVRRLTVALVALAALALLAACKGRNPAQPPAAIDTSTSTATSGSTNASSPSPSTATATGSPAGTPGPNPCGTSPAVAHSNGLGGSFYDCNPLGTYNAAQAAAACESYAVTRTGFCKGDVACVDGSKAVAWQGATTAAVWVYEGKLVGHVRLAQTALCPSVTDPIWT